MSLRDDLKAMERHSEKGTLKEWFKGTAPSLPTNDDIPDPTAKPIKSTYRYIAIRGD